MSVAVRIFDGLLEGYDRLRRARARAKASSSPLTGDGAPPTRLDKWSRPLAWRCDVCGTERPDDLIDLYSCWTNMRSGLPVSPGQAATLQDAGVPVLRTNVKHCRDRPSCRRRAPDVYARWVAPLRRR